MTKSKKGNEIEMSIDMVKCRECGENLTSRVIHNTLYVQVQDGLTTEPVQVPVSCPKCDTVMIIWATCRVNIEDVQATCIIPGEPVPEFLQDGKDDK